MKEKSTIKQIFYGQITCSKIQRDDKVAEYWGEADRYFRLLRDKLKDIPELCDLLIKYDDCAGNAHAEDLANHYSQGFKFGLLVGMEACECKYEE